MIGAVLFSFFFVGLARKSRIPSRFLADFVQFYLMECEVDFFFFFQTRYERIRSRSSRQPNSTFFSADVQRREGRKNSFPAASVYKFLGRNAPIREISKKSTDSGELDLQLATFFFFLEKKTFDVEMARQSLVCSHTTHNHTTHLQHTTQQSHRPHRGSTQAHTWLGVGVLQKGSLAASKQEQLAGSAGKKRTLHRHSLRTLHHNMTTTHVTKKTKRTTAAAAGTAATVIMADAARAARAASSTTARANGSSTSRRDIVFR